jgi:hypothetical protein
MKLGGGFVLLERSRATPGSGLGLALWPLLQQGRERLVAGASKRLLRPH